MAWHILMFQRVAVNNVITHSQTAKKGWSFSLGGLASD